jgi:hypothetical protein
MEVTTFLEKSQRLQHQIRVVKLAPKILGVFFIKTASKQPLFKAR